MVQAKWYGEAFIAAFNKEIDFNSDTIKVMLLGTGYTPDLDNHNYVDDVVAQQVSGAGYTAGGPTLTSPTFSYDDATNTFKISGGNISLPGSTFSARYAVVYDDTPATNATKPLLCLIDFEATISPSAGTFSINWDAAGIATVVVS